MIKALGGDIVNDMDEEFNVLVTDKLVRNIKLLVAINRNAHVVDLKWVTES